MLKIRLFPAFVLAIFLLSSCEKDYNYIEPPVKIDEGQQVSFSAEIQPIFDANCTASTCHGGGNDPNLTTGSAYSSLVGGGYVNTSNPEGSKLYTEVNTGAMPEPPAPKLSATNIAKILTWIKQGAKNN